MPHVPFRIPEAFRRRITELHGEVGAAWLEQLPCLVAEFEARWGLTVGSPVADLSYNYVAPAQAADGKPLMLKLGVPGGELRSEGEALRLFGGRSMARLLAA